MKTLIITMLFLVPTPWFFGCRKDLSNELALDKLTNHIIYHASLTGTFQLDHPFQPTTNGSMPGGPSWFAPDHKELALWRAAQLAVKQPDGLKKDSYVYLHSFVLSDNAKILDYSDKDSREFYSKLWIKYNKKNYGSLTRHASIVKFYFDENPDIDGFLIKDSVSGLNELVLRNPAQTLAKIFEPISYEVDPTFSCFSCKPKHFVIRSHKDSYTLIPDFSCAPGFRIEKN